MEKQNIVSGKSVAEQPVICLGAQELLKPNPLSDLGKQVEIIAPSEAAHDNFSKALFRSMAEMIETHVDLLPESRSMRFWRKERKMNNP